jgi:hypothetical protein
MEGLINSRRCAICHGQRKRLLYQQRFSMLSIGSILNGYDVVICQDCVFCYEDNIPDQSAFDVYYREMSKYEHQDHAGQPTEFEPRQIPELAQFLAKNILHPQSSRSNSPLWNGWSALCPATHQRELLKVSA